MTVKFRLAMAGTHPLLMRNARLVDPLDPIVQKMKEVTKKTQKTDSDHRELARLEWLGGVYFQEGIGPVVPGLNIHACLVQGAKLSKLGQAVKRGLFIDDLFVPLQYDGPRDLDTLCQDKNFILRDARKVQQSKVMRTRPRFRQWQLVTTGLIEEGDLEITQLRTLATAAGARVGLGDSRPMFGRFIAQVDEIADDAAETRKPARVGAL